MPEIEVFATQEEIVQLVRWLLDRRCEFIPDLHYDTSTYDQLSELPLIRNLAESIAQFYVVRRDFTNSPLELREVTTADKHFFYISPRAGGPKLLFHWGRHFERNGRMHLSATDVGYYPWYENSITSAREQPPKPFCDLYVELASMVRLSRRKIKPGKRKFWISANVERLVREGWILIGLEDFSPNEILNVPCLEAS